MKNRTPLLTLLTVVSSLLPFCLQARPEVSPIPQDKPLSFIENTGQITDQHDKQRKDIDFKLPVPGMNIFIGNGQIHYQWNKTMGNWQPEVNGRYPASLTLGFDSDISAPTSVESYRMDVTLVGANLSTPATAKDIQLYTERYYTPQFSE